MSHAVKNDKRYRYYVSQSVITQPKRLADGGRRIPAADVEQLVSGKVQSLMADEAQIFAALQSYPADAPTQRRAIDNAAQLGRCWPDQSPPDRRSLLFRLIKRIEVYNERVDIQLLRSRLAEVLLGETDQPPPDNNTSPDRDDLILSVRARSKRTGMEIKLIVDGPSGNHQRRQPDHSRLKLVINAHRLKQVFIHNQCHTLKSLAKQHQVNASYFTRLIRLTFLAPDITQAILEGRHPVELTAARLMRNTRFPLDWREQRKKLGFV